MSFTFSFIQLFFSLLYLTLPLLLAFLSVIIVLGQCVGRIEQWSVFNALYWSFITALTIGYGDIKPTHNSTKSLSLLIGLLGIIFTGILVAIAIATATQAFQQHLAINA